MISRCFSELGNGSRFCILPIMLKQRDMKEKKLTLRTGKEGELNPRAIAYLFRSLAAQISQQTKVAGSASASHIERSLSFVVDGVAFSLNIQDIQPGEGLAV